MKIAPPSRRALQSLIANHTGVGLPGDPPDITQLAFEGYVVSGTLDHSAIDDPEIIRVDAEGFTPDHLRSPVDQMFNLGTSFCTVRGQEKNTVTVRWTVEYRAMDLDMLAIHICGNRYPVALKDGRSVTMTTLPADAPAHVASSRDRPEKSKIERYAAWLIMKGVGFVVRTNAEDSAKRRAVRWEIAGLPTDGTLAEQPVS